MQLQAHLTLGEGIIAAKQAESQAIQNRELPGEAKFLQVAGLSSNTGKRHNQQQWKPKLQPRQSSNKHCLLWGHENHSRDHYVSVNSTCKKCNKVGPWASVCHNSKVRVIQVSKSTIEATDFDEDFVGSITINQINTQDWTASIFVSEFNKVVDFLIDTGSIMYNLFT